MKIIIIRIITIIFLIMILCQNFCFADSITISNKYIDEIQTHLIFIIIIGIGVLLISTLSFFILHKLAKIKNNNEESTKKVGNVAYIFTIIMAFIIHLLSLSLMILSIDNNSFYKFNIDNTIIFTICSILLFIVSIILRKKARKVSNILWIIAILTTLGIFIII